MKKVLLLLSMVLMGIHASAIQMAKTSTTRQIGGDTIAETVDVYNGVVRDVRIVNNGQPDTLMFTCNRDIDGTQVAAVFEAWWTCQIIFDYIDHVNAEQEGSEDDEVVTNSNNPILERALRKCMEASNLFTKGGCQQAAQQVMALRQGLIQARRLYEKADQYELTQRVAKEAATLRELQHCGYLH